VLKELIARGERVEEAQRELYGVCLRYGDFLASKDRTALALVAYRDAAETRVRDTEAAEHETWLRERLAAEERAALETLAKAERGDGTVADALVAVATAFARQAKDQEAAAVFARIEESLGMSPALRYHRAMQLWRELDPRKAIAELRQTVTEDPTLARAHYDLGLLLEEAGELEAALASCEKARSLADAQAETHGAEQWLLDADLRIEEVRQVLRDLGGAR
jgi:tetratricopeptide (TPR) repeat protein